MNTTYIYTLNLQLFAGTPNTNVTTDSGLSAENKEYYDRNLIEEASAQLVHAQFGQKRPIPRGSGKKVTFRKFASLPKNTTALTEGVTPDGKKLSVTEIEATVSQYGDYVTISDFLDLTAIDPMVLEATKVIGRQAGLTVDTIHRNVLQGGNVVRFARKSNGTEVKNREDLDDTCVVTVDDIKRAVAFLKKNNAPKINGDYIAIVHPNVAYDIMSDPSWRAPHEYQDTTNIYEGEIGKIAGVRFIESSEAKVYANNVYGTLIIADGAYGVTDIEGGGMQTIIKQLGSAGSADPLDQRSTVGWKCATVAEILVPFYLIRLESKSALTAEEN